MKRFFVLILALTLMFSLVGCVGIRVDRYVTQHDLSQIEKVDLYDIPEGIYEYDAGIERAINIHNEFDPIYSFSKNQYESLLTEIQAYAWKRLIFIAPYDPINKYSGFVVVVNYANGDFDIIGEFAYTFVSGRKIVFHNKNWCFTTDDMSWSDLIGKYFEK